MVDLLSYWAKEYNLRQRGFDQLFNNNYGKGTSNDQLMKEAGFAEIYDAGQATYIFDNILITTRE